MKFPHFRRKRALAFVVLAGALLLTLNYVLKSEDASGCGRTAETPQCLSSLFPKVVSSLDSLGLTGYLCYYALWGSLKHEGPLPWTKRVELCLRNEELSGVDEGRLFRKFRQNGVLAHYDSANGIYKTALAGGSDACEAYLHVFEEDKVIRKVRKVGWKNRLIPPTACHTLHCFPAELIAVPMNVVPFLGTKVAVPHEGIEVLKYMFPDTWWKEIIPPNCK
ncbi:hypothetical protein HPB47_019393 [Ixodes persulcatus]|uniref:Uncharacterized protein n=2 Tax=Ixodes persulcatus TaxID=34615 RepID=A0AC60P0F5_IXOPE|nr:hypothetical protein HPB47_009935 [Ixodes persulcatus]KAG0445132.1 hypothetical protein HPB47_019393 [Ixodes persulcatus]